MRLLIDAACGCHMGKVRKNNEDNFYFDDKCLELENTGLRNPAAFTSYIRNGLCFAVFDGMGGENFGEVASYAAAREMQSTSRAFSDFFISERKYLQRLTMRLNNAVMEEKKKLLTERCGSTMVALYFSSNFVYVCNVGDSRVYRLREDGFLQLSVDHIEKRGDGDQRKAPLTQHLGIDPEDLLIEPYIAKGKINRGDQYLLCSDGLTDMLTNMEISDIMSASEDAQTCVQNLIQAALDRGGRDNITVIVCRIE